jgi:hypothetical protein
MAVGATRQLLGDLLQRVAGPVRFQVARSDSGSGTPPPIALGGLV